MNIITKIKNWLIKKLGGYTKGEYTALQIQLCFANNEAEAHKEASDCWLHNWSIAAMSVKTERENYEAMLNCHNATAEATHSNTQSVSGAIDTIKAYCNGKDGCDSCALYDANKGCKIASIPCYWGE